MLTWRCCSERDRGTPTLTNDRGSVRRETWEQKLEVYFDCQRFFLFLYLLSLRRLAVLLSMCRPGLEKLLALRDVKTGKQLKSEKVKQYKKNKVETAGAILLEPRPVSA